MIFSIIEQALIALPLIMGAYLTLSLLKLPDFSIESAYLLGAVAAYLASDLPLPLVFLSAIGGGMIVGASVSLLSQCLHFPFLLAAIVANGFFHGLTQYLLETSVARFSLSVPFDELALLACLGILVTSVMSLGSRSQLGYSLAIYGNNPLFFDSHNLSGPYVLGSGVMIGHGLAGISGFLFAQSNGFVDLSMNVGVILLCLTALTIGKLFIRIHKPTVLTPLTGILAYFFIQQTLLRMDLNLKYFNSFQALFVLGAVFLGRKKQTLSLDHLGV